MIDPDVNMREQEALLVAGGQKQRLRQLRDAFAAWMYGGGFEPSVACWDACPLSAKYYMSPPRAGKD